VLRLHLSLSLLLLTSFLPSAAIAQLALSGPTSMQSMPGMDHSQPTKMISGKDHPELIPDITAYRLFFISVGELSSPTEARKARQRAFLSKMGPLGVGDSQAVVQILEQFKVTFTRMVYDYNARVDTAVKSGSGLPDTDEFVKQRDQLVQQTYNDLKYAMTPGGMKRLETHVQNEKHHMQIMAKEGK
jgi:hypothetical protein